MLIIFLYAVNFSIVQATNVTLVYTIDAYRPVAGEVTVTQLAFKCTFSFPPLSIRPLTTIPSPQLSLLVHHSDIKSPF